MSKQQEEIFKGDQIFREVVKQEQILQLEPSLELHFKGPFTDVVTSYLKLTNPSERQVCFKVKTTAPKKYCVRPNSGFINPMQTVNVAVMLQPFEYNPNEKNKHKFMVQTVLVPDGDTNIEKIWRDARPVDLMDSKLRCVFDMPSEGIENNNIDSNAIQAEEQKTNASKNVSETSVKASPKVANTESELKKILEDSKRLREEIARLKHENEQLKEEGLRLRQRGIGSTESGGRISSSVHASNPSQKESVQASHVAYAGDKMSEQPQSSMLYLAVILTIGLLGIFIGKFVV